MGLIFGSLLRADFTVLRRNARTVILNIALPIVILIITGLHANQKSADGFGATAFDVGLAMTYGLLSSSLIGYSSTIARDREAGVFQRLRVTPAPTWTIMCSRIMVQLILDLIMTVIVLIIGGIIDGQTFPPAQWLLVSCVSVVGGAMFLAIAQALVGLVRSTTMVNALGRILYIIFLLIGVLGPNGLLGTTVKDVSAWTPAGAIINLYEGVLSLPQWNWLDTSGLIAMVIYIVGGGLAGIRWFRWDAR